MWKKGTAITDEIRDEETKPKKENLGKDQPETPGRPSGGSKDAPRLGMAPRSEKICVQQGLSADHIRRVRSDKKAFQMKYYLKSNIKEAIIDELNQNSQRSRN